MSCCSKPSSPGAISNAAFANVTRPSKPKSASCFCGARKQSQPISPLAALGLPESKVISPSRTRDSSSSSLGFKEKEPEKDPVDFLPYSKEDQMDDELKTPLIATKSRKGRSGRRTTQSYGFLTPSPELPNHGFLIMTSPESPNHGQSLVRRGTSQKSSKSRRRPSPSSLHRTSKSSRSLTNRPQSANHKLLMTSPESLNPGQLPSWRGSSSRSSVQKTSKFSERLRNRPQSPNHGVVITSGESPNQRILQTSPKSPNPGQSPSRRGSSRSSPHRTPKSSDSLRNPPQSPNHGFAITSPKAPNHGFATTSPVSPNPGRSPSRRERSRSSPHSLTPKSSDSLGNRPRSPNHDQSPSRRRHSRCPSSPIPKSSRQTNQIPATGPPKLKEIPRLISDSEVPKSAISVSRSQSPSTPNQFRPQQPPHKFTPTDDQPPSKSTNPHSFLPQTRRDSLPSLSTFVLAKKPKSVLNPSPSEIAKASNLAASPTPILAADPQNLIQKCSPDGILHAPASPKLSKPPKASPHRDISPSISGSCFSFGRPTLKQSNTYRLPTSVPGPPQSTSVSNLNQPETSNAQTLASSESPQTCLKYGEAHSRSSRRFPSAVQSRSHTRLSVQGHLLQSKSNFNLPEKSHDSTGISSEYPKTCLKHGRVPSRPTSPFRSSVPTQSRSHPTPSRVREKTQSIAKPRQCETPKTPASVAFSTPLLMAPDCQKPNSTRTSIPSRIRNASPGPQISKSIRKFSPTEIAEASMPAPKSASEPHKSQSTQKSSPLDTLNASPPSLSEAPRTSPQEGMLPSISGGSCFSFARPPKRSHPNVPTLISGPHQLQSTSNWNPPYLSTVPTSMIPRSPRVLAGDGQSPSTSATYFGSAAQTQSCLPTLILVQRKRQRSKSISKVNPPEISNASTLTSSRSPKTCLKHGNVPSRSESQFHASDQTESCLHPNPFRSVPRSDKPQLILKPGPCETEKASTFVAFTIPKVAQNLENSQSTQTPSPSGDSNASPSSISEAPKCSPSEGMSPSISAGSCFSFAIYAPKHSYSSVYTSVPDPQQSKFTSDSNPPKTSNSSTSTSGEFLTPILARDVPMSESTPTSSPSAIVDAASPTSSAVPETSTCLASSCFPFARSPKHSHSSASASVTVPPRSKSISDFNQLPDASTSSLESEHLKTSVHGQEPSGSGRSESFLSPQAPEDSRPAPLILTTEGQKSIVHPILRPAEPSTTSPHYDQPPTKSASSCCCSPGTISAPDSLDSPEASQSDSPTILPEQSAVPSRAASLWFCRATSTAKPQVQEPGPGRARRFWARLWNTSRGSGGSPQDLASPVPSIPSASKGPGNLPYEKDERWIDCSDTRAFVIFGFNIVIVIVLTYFVDRLHDGKQNSDSVRATDSSHPGYPPPPERADSVCNFDTIIT